MKAGGPLSRIRVVLLRPSHPGNIGAAARAMKTMGITQLRLVRPKRFPHADARAMASGALDLLESARACATLEDIEKLLAHLERSLRASGYLHPRAPRRLMDRLRRLFAKARLEKVEVNILRGMLAAWDDRSAPGNS